MRLTELVDKLVALAERLRDPDPRVVVRWYNADGTVDEREVEEVFPDSSGRGRIVLHVPRPAQFAGEPGAGDVVDESDVSELDPELVLAWATGDRGCMCSDGRCASERHPDCRVRLQREYLERVRAGEKCAGPK